jgi:PAS domain S-box-containing protein
MSFVGNNPTHPILSKLQESHTELINKLNEGFELLDLVFNSRGQVEDFVFLEVNPAYEKQTGLRAVDIVGKRKKVVAPASDKAWYDYAVRAVESGETLRYEYYNHRVNRLYETRFIPVSQGKVAVLFRDITEQKEANENLSKKQRELNLIFDASPTAIFYKDTNGKFIQVNKAFGNALDIPADQLTGKTVFDLYSKKIAQNMTNDDLTVLQSKRAKLGIVEPYESPTGIRWIRTDKIPMFDESGEVTGLIGFSEDITERKKAEEALIENEAKYKELIDRLPEMVFEIDLQGKILFANSTAVEFMGYSTEELENSFNGDRLVIAEDIERLRENMRKMFVEGTRQTNEYVFVKKDGTRFPVLLISAPIFKVNKIVGARGFAVDLTERKRMEKKLSDNERLAAIGATAGMVGHDLRNPLQTITSELYLAEMELEKVPEGPMKNTMKESVAGISEQIGYMDKVVSDLQTFVKPVEAHKQIVNIKELTFSTLAQLSIPSNIQTSVDVADGLRIEIDPQLLKRVLINLITNSTQAMPCGGQLKIQSHINRKGHAQISVEDTGVGIPEEIKPKIFTPLFTTKSKGQGFGLAVCKRVIEAQGGTIGFESKVGKGSKFTIDVPTIN